MLKRTWFNHRFRVGVSILLGVLLLIVSILSQFHAPLPALATAPGIPPKLEKKTDGVYYLMWTNEDTVYVNCYPGIKPKLVPSPAKHNPARFALTCGKNPVNPYRA